MAAYSVGSVKSVANQQSWTAAISAAVAGRMCIVPHRQIKYYGTIIADYDRELKMENGKLKM
jgi:hypothetical protein